MITCGRIDCKARVVAANEFSYADAPGYKPWPDETGDCDAFVRGLAATRE
jgi:hypothetical protein